MIAAGTELAIGYPGRRVGSGFTLELRPGEVLALLGPERRGKDDAAEDTAGIDSAPRRRGAAGRRAALPSAVA